MAMATGNCASMAAAHSAAVSSTSGAPSCCSLAFSPLGSPFSRSGFRQVRRPFDHSEATCCLASSVLLRRSTGYFNLHKPCSGSRSAPSSRSDSYKSGVAKVHASIEEGVKRNETDSREQTLDSTSNSDPQVLETPTASPSNPFASGKISSRIAAKRAAGTKQPPSSSVAQKAVPLKKPVTAKPPAVGNLSANAASQLKVARPPSVWTVPTKPSEGKPASPFGQPGASKPATPLTQSGASKPTSPVNPFQKAPLLPADWEKAGARPAGAGKRVLDAFREGEKKEGNTTKFGQPIVPTNIFDEVRRTPEEIAADAFKFEITPGQLILAGSFIVIIAVMFGTVFFVWKVGAIHYNEY